MGENNHKSGFVSVLGNPNVGKSTLVNALVGEKVSIITPKAQTTRHRIFGILNHDNYQIVFSDTPGIIKTKYKLQRAMMDFTRSTFEDTDIFVYVVEPGKQKLKDEQIFEKIKNTDIPIIVVINKIDLREQDFIRDEIEFYKSEFPKSKNIIPASAVNDFNVNYILDSILEYLPQGPAYFDKDSFTDKPERFFVNEIIREKFLLNYEKEIPYSVEIVTEYFIEEENVIKIIANIITERESQKGIIIGNKGKAIKKTCTEARKDLEKFFNKKVYLETFVKVNKNWRNSNDKLKEFKYKLK